MRVPASLLTLLKPLTPARLLVTMSAASSHTLVLDSFCLKQFDDPEYTGTRVAYDKAAFEAKVNALHVEGAPLVDGYAPFCKHVFVPNFTPAVTPYLEITDANRHLLRSGYDARTEQELAVLIQWFDGKVAPPAPVAKYLDIILYSREQIRKEADAMGREEAVNDAPWGIISVKAQDVDHELPMQPITMMRNALGKEEGGSGVPLQRDAYMASVAFWSKFASIK
tara:strand:+ start:29 stop:700 length:672 start_codon:yes stop_codon:yes gene_type:complete